jgi:D-threo-aldose 1-dehydrogenase
MDLDVVLLAGRYTLLEQGALDTLLPACLARGIAVVAGGVFNSGILADGAKAGALYNYQPAPAAVIDRVARLENVCRHHRVSLAAAALQFPLHHPAVASVIPGIASLAELHDDLALLHQTVPDALWDEMRETGLLDPRAPAPAEQGGADAKL